MIFSSIISFFVTLLAVFKGHLGSLKTYILVGDFLRDKYGVNIYGKDWAISWHLMVSIPLFCLCYLGGYYLLNLIVRVLRKK